MAAGFAVARTVLSCSLPAGTFLRKQLFAPVHALVAPFPYVLYVQHCVLSCELDESSLQVTRYQVQWPIDVP
jgi:hypothetical protein